MGEMADELIDSICENFDEFYSGYNEGLATTSRYKSIECKYCGEKGYWGYTQYGWRIFIDGKVHLCKHLCKANQVNENSKLLNCPFCNNYDVNLVEDKSDKTIFVECQSCKCRGPKAVDKNKAKFLWDKVHRAQ